MINGPDAYSCEFQRMTYGTDSIQSLVPISAVSLWGAPSNLPFLKRLNTNEWPHSNQHSYSDKCPYSVSVISLFEYDYILIKRGSFSSNVLIAKTVVFLSVFLLCSRECTVPLGKWTGLQILQRLLGWSICPGIIRNKKSIFQSTWFFFFWIKLCFAHTAVFQKRNKRPVSNRGPPLRYHKSISA